MKVLIRCDASVQLGTGHLMRCLTLAEGLSAKGAMVEFASAGLPANLAAMLESSGFALHRLMSSAEDAPFGVDADADISELRRCLERGGGQWEWVIVDHYGLDARWESQARRWCRRVMVIDDVADRPHDGDLLLDQNLYANAEERYRGKVPAACRTLLGPTFALLRPEFAERRARLRQRDGSVRRVLIFFGGSDLSGYTERAIEAVLLVKGCDLKVDVLAGYTNPRQPQLKQRVARFPNARFLSNVSNMAELLESADLAISAAGTNTWERCCMGLPSMAIAIADNQSESARYLAEIGAVLLLPRTVEPAQIAEALLELLSDSEAMRRMGKTGMTLVDGLGRGRVIGDLLAT